MKTRMVEKASLSERCVHWIMSLSFLVLLLTGMGFLYNSLSWMAAMFGGTQLAKAVHEWAGVAFAVSLALSAGNYLSESLCFTPEDGEWLGKLGGYLSREPMPPQGRLNAGQKAFYLMVLGFGALIALSGLMIWLGGGNRGVVLWGHFLHNAAFLAFAATVPMHIYLATAANPGTFRVMTRGTVPLAWARKKHGRWVKELGL